MERSTRIKILMVTRNLPFPPDRGEHQRDLALINHYSEIFDVTVISPVQDRSAATEAVRYFEGRCKFNYVVVPAKSKLEKIMTVLTGYFTFKPSAVSLTVAREIKEELLRLTSRESFDIVHLAHTSSADYARYIGGENVMTAIDMHNVEEKRFHALLREARGIFSRTVAWIDLLMMKRFERNALQCADFVFVCSDIEKNYLLDIHGLQSGSKVTVVPNGVTLRGLNSYPIARDDTPRLLFIGSLNYSPNSEGIIWFIDNVMPSLVARFDGIELMVVGHSPPKRLVEKASRNINVKGYVGDVTDVYIKASVAVVPLFAGGGTRLKILEAFSLGAPVVSTSIGAEGILAIDGKHLCVAENAEEFVAAISQILVSPDFSNELRASAYTLVKEKYSWGQCGAKASTALIERWRNR